MSESASPPEEIGPPGPPAVTLTVSTRWKRCPTVGRSEAPPRGQPHGHPDLGARLAALPEPLSAGRAMGLPGVPGVSGDRTGRKTRVDGTLVLGHRGMRAKGFMP